ncbi:MAG: ABC transporter substrate-binding protein, partial [Natronomonas sp.]
INASDDILPNTTLEIADGDTETDPDTGLSEARRLVQQDNIDMMAAATSSSVASVLSEYATSQDMLPTLIQAADRALTTGEDCRMSTYRPNPHTHQAGDLAGQWLTEEFGDQGFVLYQDYSYGAATREGVGRGVEKAGGEIIEDAATPLGNQQFESVIDRIDSADPDWLLMGAVGTGATAFLSQAANRGLDVPMGSQSLPAYNTGEVGADIIDQFSDLYRTPALYTREIDTEANNQHVQAFQDEYGIPPNYSSETGYQVGRFIGEGIHEAGTIVPSEARSALEGITIQSARGENTIRACDHQGTPPLYIAQVTGVDEELGLGTHEIIEQVDSADYTTPCEDIECQM